MSIRRELADANPNDVGLKVDLAQALLAVGNVSELEEKRDYYEQALILREYLAKKASGGDRAKRMRDVWITHGMLGDLHSSLDNATEAKKCYSEALRLARELCPADEQSPRQRLDLAHSYVNLGNSKRTLGETQPAKQDYTKALDILTLLAENDPRNIEVQTSYLLTLARAGQHEKASKEAPKTRDLAPDNVLHLYNIACCHSICVSAVADGRPLDQLSPEQQSLQTEYAKQAIALLEEAIAKGLDDFEYLKIDPDIAPIREYPDYRKLLEGRE